MAPEDRQRLIALRFPPEVIERTEQVLAVWGVERVFATCFHCGKACIDPDLPRGRHLRKKLPAELHYQRELRGCRDGHGRVACEPCEFIVFEHGPH